MTLGMSAWKTLLNVKSDVKTPLTKIIYNVTFFGPEKLLI